MTNKVEQSASYYELLANRHEASGRGANQARVYRELVALVRQCTSYEEIQSRMKAGGYFESPAQAVVLDKLAAHRDAATQLGFQRLAQIYQQQYDAVAADYGASWSTAWQDQAKQELHRIGNVVDAFNDLMSSYYEFRCAHFLSQQEPLQKMRGAISRMQELGENPETVVNTPYYRLHSALAEDKYQAALQAIRFLLVNNPDNSALQADWEARTRALTQGGDQQALTQKLQEDQARKRRSINMCIAPDEAPGPYAYEAFYEGTF